MDVLKGSKVLEVEGIERVKKEEEEMKSRHYRIVTAIIPYVIFLFYVLCATID